MLLFSSSSSVSPNNKLPNDEPSFDNYEALCIPSIVFVVGNTGGNFTIICGCLVVEELEKASAVNDCACIFKEVDDGCSFGEVDGCTFKKKLLCLCI